MGSKAGSLLQWVLFIVIVFSPVYGLRGSASQLPTVPPPNSEASPSSSQAEVPTPSSTPEASGIQQETPASNAHFTLPPAQGSVASPASIASPENHEQNGIPVAAPPKELSDHLYPVNHSNGISPAMIPTPPEVKNASNITEGSPVSPSHQLGSSPMMSPVSHEGKQPLNITDAPFPSNPGFSGTSPATSPLPHDMQPPSSAQAPQASHLQPLGSPPAKDPVPNYGNTTSNITHSPAASSLHPLESPPGISPTPHEVKEPSNVTHSPHPSHPLPSGLSLDMSPAPPQVKKPSNITVSPLPSEPSPVTSPTAPQVKEPSNATHSPLPSESSPMTSPTPPQVMEPSNATHSPLPSESSPMTSPKPPQVKEPSNATRSPLPSESSPMTSPTPPQVKEPSNATRSPLPSESSPMTSPTPPQVKEPSNATHSPFPSLPVPLESSPATSPAPSEAKQPPNTVHSPLPSHPLPSESSPVISPAPHEFTEPSNSARAPFASHPKPAGLYPAISPAPHGVEEPSNITLPSHPLPSVSSPLLSPASPEVKDPTNITHSPLASAIPPTASPTPHEAKDPSNSTRSPLPPHLPPSELSPAPAPPKEPENILHAPSASHRNPWGSSPAVSPTPHEVKEPPSATVSPLHSPMTSPPHEVKDPSNVTHSPFPSPPYPSDLLPAVSPAVSPVPQGEKQQPNATNAPTASPPHPSLSSPLLSPMPNEANNTSNIAHAPSPSPPNPSEGIQIQTPAVAPVTSPPPSPHLAGPMIAPIPSHIPAVSPSIEGSEHGPSPHIRGPSISPIQAPSFPPVVAPKNNGRNHAPSLSPIQIPYPSANRYVARSPTPSSVIPSQHSERPIHPPVLSPRFSRKPRASPPKPVWAFPPPPPNLDCKSLSCEEPYAYPPPRSVCNCVLPINVGLRLSVSLYTFFPLTSELAQEIASGIFVKQSQVRIMGANSTTEDAEKTSVFIDLVPFGPSFQMNTALLIFERFWHKQVLIKASYFGDYDVLYVRYPGLPPSPPMAPGDGSVDGGLGDGENARTMKPLGVDVGKRKGKLSDSLIAIVILASVIASVISIGAAWLLLLKCRKRSSHLPPTQHVPPPSRKPSGIGQSNLGSGPSSTSASFTSSIAPGSAKTFSLAEMERATNRFDESEVIGEGGFGRVYQGTLEDGSKVAIKVLKRQDHQGGREFLAEVEMLSRLHHRNLVKLIGICTEDCVRCLVYELVPNGSVESHLHGVDKETSPLDWNARMKIALGAARGLAYLHEDSSPRVIHRDFKSSNILLEHDFTPKVSDFGLARAALDEGNVHISTRVMGTFGYVAPEYAMTGHLLVKSDVYSYGVVLLELLTGRKPVDMSQPPGQENLVSWAHPLLTSMDGLEKMVDPALGASISLDSVAKVAAIASMCVQPEVSHRPFMGEVVQALKLVCYESGDHRRSCSQDDLSTKDSDIRISTGQEERVLSESDIFCTSAAFAKDESGSFRRYTSSGPLTMNRSQKFWDEVKGFSSGSMMEHRIVRRPGSGLHG